MSGAVSTYVTQAWSSTMRLVMDDRRALRYASGDFEALLANVDAVASRFRPDSELSRANAARGRPVPISKLLTKLIAAALGAAEQSGGAVDPTVGRELCRIGYDRDISLLPPAGQLPGAHGAEPAGAVRRHDWQDVRLDRWSGLLQVPRGVQLDLGATTKAYVADHAAQALARRYDTAVLVELGGDVAVAGDRPGGWNVLVAEREGAAGQLVRLRHGAVTTSTTVVRRWAHDGAAMHHILDPVTATPVDGPWRTATVYAPRALAANVASTAAIVLGEHAPQWLATRALAARLVAGDGSVLTVGDWPAPVPSQPPAHRPGRGRPVLARAA
jgi:thiamine biosynthesis lipoprotein